MTVVLITIWGIVSFAIGFFLGVEFVMKHLKDRLKRK